MVVLFWGLRRRLFWQLVAAVLVVEPALGRGQGPEEPRRAHDGGAQGVRRDGVRNVDASGSCSGNSTGHFWVRR